MSTRAAQPSPSAARRDSKARAILIEAYREGLGLAAVVVIRGSAGIRIAATGQGCDDGPRGAGDLVAARWWCRRAEEAVRVAAAATAHFRRRESRDDALRLCATGPFPDLSDISIAIESIAGRLCVALYSDEEVSTDAVRIIDRVDEEMANLQRAGQLKSVNRAYRAHRLEATARGDKSPPYAEWFNKYKVDLVRQLAAALRFS